MDITITCKTCGKKFVFTDEEIAFYLEKKLSPPRHCHSCRKNGNAGMEEIRKKYGVKQSNIADNPQNHYGISRISSPDIIDPDKHYKPHIYHNRYIRVEIANKFYYLRIVWLGNKEYTFLYVEEDAGASLFSKDFDEKFIIDKIKEHRSDVTSHKVLMAPIDVVDLEEDTSTLKLMQFRFDQLAYSRAERECQKDSDVIIRGYITVLPLK